MKTNLIILVIALVVISASPLSHAVENYQQFPASLDSGHWESGHVQGIAIDEQGGYVYYSFTDLLVKYDFSGNLIATLEGWTGHLGDMDLNPDDGKVYGSLEYKADEAFYIAIIDGRKLDRIGIKANESEVFQTVYLPEVVRDYVEDMNGDGKFDGNVANTLDHRYGCSGIDGVSFGPAFGRTDGLRYLTVAYGIYSNTQRNDNNHQVLLQYDISNWEQYAQPLSETAPHHSGPTTLQGKYFVHTGNTTYGVQNLAYDSNQQRWFLGVYQGKKAEFPNYLLFAVDADTAPRQQSLIGVSGIDGEWEQGLLLTLANDGLSDRDTGIRGWMQKADVGMQPLENGLFYMAVNFSNEGWESATLKLMRWTGDYEDPLTELTAPR